MSCACRARQWCAFIRGLAQVHRLDSMPALEPACQPFSAAVLSWRLSASRQRHDIRGAGFSKARTVAGPPASSVGEGRTVRLERQTPKSVAGLEPSPQVANLAFSPSTSRAPRRGTSEAKKASTTIRQERKPSKYKPQSGSRGATKTAVTGGRRDGKASAASPKLKNEERKRKQVADKASTGSKGRKKESTSSKRESRAKREAWTTQKDALKEKFPEGWKPRKRLSPDAMEGMRALHTQFPEVYTTEALANKFPISAEAVRRILKSKWEPTVEEEQERQERWFRRGMQVWTQKAALGVKPPRRWRVEGIARDPTHHERARRAALREKEIEEREIAKYKAARPWLKFAESKKAADVDGQDLGRQSP